MALLTFLPREQPVRWSSWWPDSRFTFRERWLSSRHKGPIPLPPPPSPRSLSPFFLLYTLSCSFSCKPHEPIPVFAGNKHLGTIIPKQNHFVTSESHWGFQRRRTRSRCWAGTEKRPHPSLPLTFLLRTPTWRSSEGGSGIYSLWDIPRTDSCLLTTVQPLGVTGRSSAAVGPCGTSCPDSCLQGCCPVTQSCPTFCNPMDRSMPGFPILHYLLEFAQTPVHRVSDAIQPSHPLSSPSPPALNLSQHQGLFQWVSSSHQVAKIVELRLQHQSFQWIFRTDFL